MVVFVNKCFFRIRICIFETGAAGFFCRKGMFFVLIETQKKPASNLWFVCMMKK